MSAPRLRWALTSLYRERRNESLSLTRDAERAIGRHVVTRWSLAAATVAFAGVVASLGWMVGLSATLDEDTETVRMLYDASALPQEFDVTLVSEPLSMVID